MKLEEILAINAIEVNAEVKNKSELLIKMINLADKSGKVSNKDEALKDILEREKLMSTGIGKGIALPHAKTNWVKDSVGSFVTLREPVNFESLDGEPVNLVFMLLGKEANVGLHLRILSKVSRILNNIDYRNSILELKNGLEVIEFFRKLEDED
jgi:fructose-specific phosphotransferase system IIA component